MIQNYPQKLTISLSSSQLSTLILIKKQNIRLYNLALRYKARFEVYLIKQSLTLENMTGIIGRISTLYFTFGA